MALKVYSLLYMGVQAPLRTPLQPQWSEAEHQLLGWQQTGVDCCLHVLHLGTREGSGWARWEMILNQMCLLFAPTKLIVYTLNPVRCYMRTNSNELSRAFSE